MQKRIQLPGGRVVEVPDDITPAEELALVEELDAQDMKPVTSSPRREPSTMDGIKAGASEALRDFSLIPGGPNARQIRNLVRRENWPMLAGGAGAMLGGPVGSVLMGAAGKAAQIMASGEEPESVGEMVADIGISSLEPFRAAWKALDVASCLAAKRSPTCLCVVPLAPRKPLV